MTVKLSIPGDIAVSSISPQSDLRVGQLTSINFNILLPNKYEKGGYLEITFPPEVDLNNLVCYPYIGFVS